MEKEEVYKKFDEEEEKEEVYKKFDEEELKDRKWHLAL